MHDRTSGRFLADEEDFAPEKLAEAGVTKVFRNDGEIDECYSEIREFIKKHM